MLQNSHSYIARDFSPGASLHELASNQYFGIELICSTLEFYCQLSLEKGFKAGYIRSDDGPKIDTFNPFNYDMTNLGIISTFRYVKKLLFFHTLG